MCCCIKQNKGLTFHNFPKKGSASEEWRKQLLQKINQEDESFNPDRRFNFLDEFLRYLKQWKTSVTNKARKFHRFRTSENVFGPSAVQRAGDDHKILPGSSTIFG